MISISCNIVIFQCIYELVKCYPKLEKVIIISSDIGSYQPKHETMFMATIKAIDPEVIEFRMDEVWRTMVNRYSRQ